MFFPGAAWSFFMSGCTQELLLMREQFVFRLVFTIEVKTRVETFPGLIGQPTTSVELWDFAKTARCLHPKSLTNI